MANRARRIRERAQAQWPGAIVVERGPGHIKHRHPTIPNLFMLDSAVGEALHYGPSSNTEIDSAWQAGVAPWDYQMVNAPYNAFALANFASGQVVRYVDPASGEDITFQPQQLQWTNDLDQIQAIASPQSVIAQVQEEDKLFWQGAYGTGLDFTWYAEPVRLAKKLRIGALANLPPPSATIIAGGNPVLRLRFIFQISNNVDVYVNGVLWNKNSRVATQGRIEFRLGTQVLWSYDVPHVFQQSNGDTDDSDNLFEERLYKTGPNLFVEVRVPWAWLQTARFPIVIDPTIDSRVGASADDANETSAGNTQITSTVFNVDVADEWAGARIGGITISAGSTVTVSYLTLYFETAASDEPDLTFTGDDTATPAAFVAGTANYNISARTDTTASVAWSNLDLGAPGAFNTDSLNTIIQELVTSYAPYSSGYMAILWRSTNGTAARDAEVRFYDGDTSTAPLLHIEFTEAGAYTVSKTESVAVAEVKTLAMDASTVARTETAIATADAITARMESSVAKTESVAVVDSKTVTLDPLAIAKTETIAVADSITIALDALAIGKAESAAVTDAVQVEEVTEDLLISKTESVAVADSRTITLDAAAIAKAESIAVVDSKTVTLDLVLSVSESIGVSDSITIALDPLAVSRTEASAVADAPTLTLEISIAKVESIGVVDSVSLATAALEISRTETTAVTDTVSVYQVEMDVHTIGVADTIGIADTRTLSFSALEVSDVETVTVSDTPSLGTDAMAISQTDSVALSESCAASITVGWEILTSEALTLEDILFIYGPATVAVSNLDARGREIEALDRYK